MDWEGMLLSWHHYKPRNHGHLPLKTQTVNYYTVPTAARNDSIQFTASYFASWRYLSRLNLRTLAYLAYFAVTITLCTKPEKSTEFSQWESD